MQKVNLREKFEQIDEYWSPRIVGQVNEMHVKIARIKGEFVWHHHEAEDEMFMVIKGRLLIRFRDRDLWLEEGEIAIIPRGAEHLPIAKEETHIMLLEPKGTLNTGNVQNARTVTDPAEL